MSSRKRERESIARFKAFRIRKLEIEYRIDPHGAGVPARIALPWFCPGNASIPPLAKCRFLGARASRPHRAEGPQPWERHVPSGGGVPPAWTTLVGLRPTCGRDACVPRITTVAADQALTNLLRYSVRTSAYHCGSFGQGHRFASELPG